MADELARVRGRVEVLPARIVDEDQIQAELQDVKAAIRDAFAKANPGADAELLAELDDYLAPAERALDSAALVEAYSDVVPCVEAFVASEIDTQTPGDRGLGRASSHPPRFGAAFRGQLSDPAAREEFAQLIERMIFQTYAGTAAALQSFYDEPTPPRARPAVEVFEEWVPRMYVGTKNFGDQTMEMISSAHAKTEQAISTAAERHGLLGGLRRGKRERILIECASFWVAAGAALYWVPAES